jgi:hypothetical protein
MSELRKTLEEEVRKITDEPMPEPNEPIRLETDGVFDSAGYPFPQAGEFTDNPMATLMQPLIQYFEAIKPKAFEPPKTEHKVRVFQFTDRTFSARVEEEIQAILNDGYRCHMPTVVGDFVIMDFSRRKESEENEREQ